MENLVYLVNGWSRGVFVMKKMNHLQQEILQTLTETNKPCEALAAAYQMLTDEQKIAFILAGGVPSLFRYQQHSIRQMRTGRDVNATLTSTGEEMRWETIRSAE